MGKPGGVRHEREKTSMQLRRHGRWLVVPALLLVVAACGGDDDTDGTEAPDGTDAAGGTAAECTEPDEVRLQLQWVAQSQFAGYFAALDEGMYEDECLERDHPRG